MTTTIRCFWLEPTAKRLNRKGALFWRRVDTGKTLLLVDAPPGAMWHAHWMGDRYRKADDRYLFVMTPGGAWAIDGDRPDGGTWVRFGDPPELTVEPGVVLAPHEGLPGFRGRLVAGVLHTDTDPEADHG